MIKFWKNNKKWIVALLLTIITGSSISIFDPEYISDFFKAPIYYRNVGELSHDYTHQKEMTFEILRLMSDNYDSTKVYIIADDKGIVYEVDVRWVNGPNGSDKIIPIAFVGKPMYRTYPVYIAPADGRMYINMHDNESGETQNTYLYNK